MSFLAVIGFAAATFGALAPALCRSRPLLALAAVVLLPALLLSLIYICFGAANDWEGMGALAYLILSAGWIIISLTAGAIILFARRRLKAKSQRT